MKALLLCASLCLIALAASAQQPPSPPQTHLEWGTANEAGEKPLYMCFHAEAGVRYVVQQANAEDYNSSSGTGFPWHQVGSSIYGLGQDVRVPVYTLVPPPVDPDAPTGDQWSYALPSVSMRLCPLADGSGVMVGWATGYYDYTRQFFPSTGVASLPQTGFYHTDAMNFLWYKGEEVSATDPQLLAKPLNPEQSGQWPLIQQALPAILSGAAGGGDLPETNGVMISGSAKGRFWRLYLEYPDSDGDGIPDWLEAKGFVNSAGVRVTSDPFTTDTDGDGVSDFEEWAAGTNPADAASHPYKVLRAAPYVGEAGARLDGAVIFYFNDVLPEGFTLPADCVKYVNATKDPVTLAESWSLEAVPGTSVLLPGRRSVAWLPSAPLHADDGSGGAFYHVPRYNHLYNLTAANTGLTPMVAFKSKDSLLADANPDALGWMGFSTTTLTDTIGPAVLKVSPGINYVEVAPTASVSVRWSQPLAPATLNATNVTLTVADTGEPVSATLNFNYGLELVTPHPDFDPNTHEWRAANTLTLTPGAALQPDTLYTVTLGTGCQNLMGKPLLHAYTWSFRTRPAPASITEGGGPHVTSMFPAAYSTNVSVASLSGAPIALNFSGAVDASTLTTDTVHVRRRGIGADEDVTLSYNSSAHRLDILLTNGAVANTRYEITLDAASILGVESPPQPLQGDSKFVFTTQASTAPPSSVTPVYPLGGGGGGGGPTPGGGGSPDPQEPPPLTLSVSYGDGDAGAYAEVEITLPDGSVQTFVTETVTDDYQTIDLPEVPDGSEVVITPGFTKGSDKNQDHHEEAEIGVQMQLSSQSCNDGSSYCTFLLAANEVTSAGPLGGNASYQNTDKVREKLKSKKVLIDPIAADKGRLGDTVPSNHEGSSDPNVKAERHFVTPKSNEHLTDEYATLEVNLTDDEFTYFEWASDSDGVPGATARQRKVSRSGPAKHVLKLNYKDSSQEAAKLNAWVVWCEVTPRQGSHVFQPVGSGTEIVGAIAWIPETDLTVWKFKFKIRPTAIIGSSGSALEDRPALSGSLPLGAAKVPGANVDYSGPSGGKADSATTYWDLSRKLRWTIQVPQGFNLSTLSPSLPQSLRSNFSFPTGDAEGNDDPEKRTHMSQNNDPYHAGTGGFLDNAVGELTSYDAPSMILTNTWGQAGLGTFSAHSDFKEFARLLIWDRQSANGGKWFRISDFSETATLWRVNVEATWSGTAWVNGIGGSMSGTGFGSNP